ncbi:glucose-6-phosphate dehydrogenase [Pirellulaceae bacterium]|jgi:glucose-6-phosphate 1-dehydrogenase|nr:glucose-6-phosphate dehydrogenase [Pirellulaceae bacterium]MDB4650539.1 glucose-6-phosphate dehydrogenase [Pirellulaceae bacterium]
MSNTIVIFGASGDLTSRKLIPALYSLYLKKRLPGDVRIVGCSRSPFSSEQWRDDLEKTTEKFTSEFESDSFKEFAASIFYHKLDIGTIDDFRSLFRFLNEIEGEEDATRIYYLSTAPRFFCPAIENLGIAHKEQVELGSDVKLRGNLNRRVVIEKPFGNDLDSAHALNEKIHEVFAESQVYRIDHYLGKETVQNMLVLRFANSIFEPMWNRNYIDNVQIICSESVDVGRRGGYYNSSGVLRDMFQNHLLQLLMITAMECPARFNAGLVRDEKVKVLQAIKPFSAEQVGTETFRAQYNGYLDSEGVPSDSKTATFAAIKLHVENWRWQGVPFYLCSGKALAKRSTHIVIQFHDPPTLLFSDGPKEHWENNRLIIQIQPDEGIRMRFTTKVPDAGMDLRTTDLDFNFADEYSKSMPDSYQRLLLDAIKGDASLFARSDEVEFAWKIIDPIINTWDQSPTPKLYGYKSGVEMPESCDQWMHFQHKSWWKE